MAGFGLCQTESGCLIIKENTMKENLPVENGYYLAKKLSRSGYGR
mgnify:CR=1 FL=1